MAEDKSDQLTKKELEEALIAQGKKLGFLIGNSTLPDRMKQELVALVLKMSHEQIERLLNIFEAKFLDESTREIDEKYTKQIKQIVDDFEAEQKKNAAELINNVKQINID